MKCQIRLYMFIIFLLIPVQMVLSQTIKTKVLVQITLDQKTAKETGNQLTDFLKQELTGSGDAVTVSDSEDVRISIMMLQNRTTTGDTLGYVISTIFLSPTDCQGNKSYSYLTSLLSTAKEAQFKMTAANIAATFNDIKKSLSKNNQTQ